MGSLSIESVYSEGTVRNRRTLNIIDVLGLVQKATPTSIVHQALVAMLPAIKCTCMIAVCYVDTVLHYMTAAAKT